jgi:hypothetical protein
MEAGGYNYHAVGPMKDRDVRKASISFIKG